MRPPSFPCRPSWRSAGGFTLVELLTVVAIGAVLAALLFGAGKKALDQACRTRCAGRLSTLTTGILAFAADHDGRVPSGWCNWYPYVWQIDVSPYVAVTYTTRSIAGSVFQCPSVTQAALAAAGTGAATYSLNINLLGSETSAAQPARKLASLPNLARTILAADCYAGNTDRLSPLQLSPASIGTVAFRHAFPNPARPARVTSASGLVSYGTGRANVAFCDGHVEALLPADAAGGGTNTVIWSP